MKLNNKRTILVGLAFMSISAFWQVYDGIIPLILKNTFNVNEVLAGAVMALDNVLALFLLPVFGLLSDRTHTRIGRRMPYIVVGTVLASIAIVLVPIGDHVYSLPLFIVGLGLALLAMSSYRSPAVALMPDVTPKPLRSKGNAIINLMGAVGGITMLILIKVLIPKTDHPSYLPVFAVLIVFMLVCVGLLFFTVNEPRAVKQMQAESRAMGIEEEVASEEVLAQEAASKTQKMPADVARSLKFLLASIFLWFMGYNAITTAFSKYANHMWGLEGGDYAMVLMVAQAAAIVAFIPVGILSSHLGRKRTILCGIVMLTIAFGSGIFFRDHFSWLMFLFFSLAGIGWALINVNSYPMVVEMSKGADVGRYTGYYYTFSMAAQIVTPILSGAVLQYMGYQYLFPYGTLFVALSFGTLLFVHHGDNRPTARKGIEAFDVDD